MGVPSVWTRHFDKTFVPYRYFHYSRVCVIQCGLSSTLFLFIPQCSAGTSGSEQKQIVVCHSSSHHAICNPTHQYVCTRLSRNQRLHEMMKTEPTESPICTNNSESFDGVAGNRPRSLVPQQARGNVPRNVSRLGVILVPI